MADEDVRASEWSIQDVDELTEAATQLGWDCEYRQLEAGPFVGHVRAFEFDDVSVESESSDRRIEVAGTTPRDCATFLLGKRREPLVVRGEALQHGSLAVCPPGSEFCVSSRSVDSDRMIVIRVAAERFRQDLRTLRRADVPKELTVLRLTDRQLARIESTVADALVEPPARGIEQCELEGNLVSAVVAAVPADARAPNAEVTGLSVYRTAREFLRESMGEPVRLADLCRIAGASESTLRRAFRRQAGVSPTAFLRAQRLAHARRLLKGRLVRSVSDAALQSGFTELGRFAGHYRTMFGELPSKTFAEHV